MHHQDAVLGSRENYFSRRSCGLQDRARAVLRGNRLAGPLALEIAGADPMSDPPQHIQLRLSAFGMLKSRGGGVLVSVARYVFTSLTKSRS